MSLPDDNRDRRRENTQQRTHLRFVLSIAPGGNAAVVKNSATVNPMPAAMPERDHAAIVQTRRRV